MPHMNVVKNINPKSRYWYRPLLPTLNSKNMKIIKSYIHLRFNKHFGIKMTNHCLSYLQYQVAARHSFFLRFVWLLVPLDKKLLVRSEFKNQIYFSLNIKGSDFSLIYNLQYKKDLRKYITWFSDVNFI